MVQILPPKKLSAFGQFARGAAEKLGSTLSEQLPKYIERGALKEGLSQFEKERSGLSPTQQLTKLFAIPGMTPQMIQSYADLAQREGQREAFLNRPSQEGPSPKDVQFGQRDRFQRPPASTAMVNQITPQAQAIAQQAQQMQQGQDAQQMLQEQQQIQQQSPTPGNPLRPEAVPVPRWTPEERDADIANEMRKNRFLTPQEAAQRSADNEARYLDQIKTEREKDAYFEDQRKKLNDRFTSVLETNLQKKGDETYKDVIGELRAEGEKQMYDELKRNPNANIEDIAHKYAKRFLETAKDKEKLKQKAFGRDLWDRTFKHGSLLSELKAFQKTFSKSGNLEEYYNILNKDFGMSPQQSALIAYPLDNDMQKFVDSLKTDYRGLSKDEMALMRDHPTRARNAAINLTGEIKRSDNILSIAKAISNKYPDFDQQAFFSQLVQEMDEGGFTHAQERQIAEGRKDFLPNWGDAWLQRD